MIRQLAILAIAAICLAKLTTANVVPSSEILTQASKIVNNALTRQIREEDLNSLQESARAAGFAGAVDTTHDPCGHISSPWYPRSRFPRGLPWSPYYPETLDEAVHLFQCFISAPDIPTFLYVVAWASFHVNEDISRYITYTAIMHRPDTGDFVIYSPCEVFTEYCFNTDFMARLNEIENHLLSVKQQPDSVIPIEANYTGWFITGSNDIEHNLTYFREDVHLNSLYMIYHMRYPFWNTNSEMLRYRHRGEVNYWMHNMIQERYNFERLAHGLAPVQCFDWDQDITTGYYPMMTYRNGMHFPTRPDGASVPQSKYRYLQEIRHFDSRVADVVDSGFVRDSSGTFINITDLGLGLNIISNIVEGNVDSYNRRYYGSINQNARRIYGFSWEPESKYRIVPSALELPYTSLRDPTFYCMNRKLLSYVNTYLQQRVPEVENGIPSPEVVIQSAEISPLVTFYDYSDTTVRRVQLSPTFTYRITARQMRLNHKPFYYKITVNAVTAMDVTIRCYLGPHVNIRGENATINSQNFYAVDIFRQSLNAGVNHIVRKDIESPLVVPDFTSDIFVNNIQSGISYRHLLPKGKPEGMLYELVFYISLSNPPSTPSASEKPYDRILVDDKFVDYFKFSSGFIEGLSNPTNLTNVYRLQVPVYHRSESDLNLTTQDK